MRYLPLSRLVSCQAPTNESNERHDRDHQQDWIDQQQVHPDVALAAAKPSERIAASYPLYTSHATLAAAVMGRRDIQ
jgi:hypothetical protein